MAVSLTINGHVTTVATGPSLFEVAEGFGVRVPTSCQKQGKCKECILEVVAGMGCLSERTKAEEHLKGNFRLACQCRVVAEAGEVKCHTMRRGNMRIERRALGLPVSKEKLPLEPAVTREGKKVLIDGEVVDEREGPLHGIAMDLGTTTVVVRLLNLETGELVADASFENPQRFGGSDVMSRIHFDTVNGGKLLMRTLAGYLSHTIESFPVDPTTIYEMVVVGNSTMRDLFFRQSVYSIGQNPYQSVTEIEMAQGVRTTTALVETGRRCLLPIHPKARVYGAPIISGHVGADAAACMLAIDLMNEERTVAVMDIGTNTELILGNKHRILAASCPAGPAFEGGAISCGMPALDGAIEDVRINERGEFELGVIGEEAAGGIQGVCGSGLVDLMSELLRTERMNAMGRFADDAHRVTLDAAHDIHFLESDVNELAQAKGANVAGLQVVFQTYGLAFEDLDVFYLAGGFGRHLKADAARRIGLIPNVPDEKIVQIGNAAIEGACIALLSKTKRAELEALVRRVEHCRLETHPSFFDFFVEGCQFKAVESAPRAGGGGHMMELLDTSPTVQVEQAEYTRLLGYPPRHELSGRALELAEWAREWYAKNGRPWIYARQCQLLRASGGVIEIDGVEFSSARLEQTLKAAGATSALMVAVSAGPEAEAEAQRLWKEEKPDEYFFLEIFGSAVVENLVMVAAGRLCAWADGQKLAVLPHYSPGYPEWEIQQQSRLLELLVRDARQPAEGMRGLRGRLEVLSTGMLRPKKSLLAVFGLTAHMQRVQRLTGLVPCQNCSFARCEFRRAPYQPGYVAEAEVAAVTAEATEGARTVPLDLSAKYAVNPRALERWARERLTIEEKADGTLDAVFRYEGTTCSNMGRAMMFDYRVKLGARAEGYPLVDMACAPAAGDEGHKAMCRYISQRDSMMQAIEEEKPLLGQPLNEVLTWSRPFSGAGCYCEAGSRQHKWGLVLETLHFALAKREGT